MKRLLILVAVIAAGVAANAASFKWTAANIYGPDITTKWSGTVNLYAVVSGVDTLVDTATASSAGTVANKAFSSDVLVGGNSYDFFFTVEDGSKTFKSTYVAAAAQATSTSNINFGNQATATQNASNWASSGGGEPVPEPTSGLLVLIGAAGLALKRKRA